MFIEAVNSVTFLNLPIFEYIVHQMWSKLRNKNLLIRSFRTAFISILFCCSFSTLHAQADSLLGKFSLAESNGQVAISWQMLAGNTCNGIQIFRSINGTDFSRIGIIAGICGSITEPVNYFFTDTMPVLNAINYYYLEFGGFGPSNVIAIEIIDYENEGYQLKPHPFQNTGTIYFDGITGNDYSIYVFDVSGKAVLFGETSDDKFDIAANNMPAGLYVFTIADASNTIRISGKFIVQR